MGWLSSFPLYFHTFCSHPFSPFHPSFLCGIPTEQHGPVRPYSTTHFLIQRALSPPSCSLASPTTSTCLFCVWHHFKNCFHSIIVHRQLHRSWQKEEKRHCWGGLLCSVFKGSRARASPRCFNNWKRVIVPQFGRNLAFYCQKTCKMEMEVTVNNSK